MKTREKRENNVLRVFFFFSNSPILPTSGNLTWKQEPEKRKQNFWLMQLYQTVSSQRWWMNCDLIFLVNNYCWCVIFDWIFSNELAKQWPKFELTMVLDKIEIKVIVS